jgi:peptidoglycan/LPS O-acetylase OafA/YrhL
MTELPHGQPPPRCPRYESLDFWRGTACLLVIMYHSVLVYLGTSTAGSTSTFRPILQFMGTLWVGVPLFFVISGYCIAATGDTSRWRAAGIRSYFVRRFRRIYPPLWIVICATVGFFLVVDVVLAPGLLTDQPWAQLRPWWYSPWQWLGNLTLTETWRYHVGGGQRAHFPGQAWTLCYEEQFYAVVGALLLARRHFFRGVAAVTAGTLAMMLLAWAVNWDIEGFFFDGNWLMFAAGVFVYYVSNYRSPREQLYGGAFLLACATLAGNSLVNGAGVAFAFAAALLALKPVDRTFASLIVARPIMFCGQMCYSLYLVHQILAKAVSESMVRAGATSAVATLFVTVPLSLAVCIAAGWIFHRTVERRFMNQPRTASAGLTAREVPVPAVLAS